MSGNAPTVKKSTTKHIPTPLGERWLGAPSAARLLWRQDKGRKNKMKDFKNCPYCKVWWTSYNEFRADPLVYYIGKSEDSGMVLFQFVHGTCGTTLSVTSNDLDKYFTWINKIFEKKDPRDQVQEA